MQPAGQPGFHLVPDRDRSPGGRSQHLGIDSVAQLLAGHAGLFVTIDDHPRSSARPVSADCRLFTGWSEQIRLRCVTASSC